MKDLRHLPKLRDSLTYLYVEHCRIDREARAIAIHDASGRTPVPCASLALLMLGPGTAITHAAVATLAENNCLVAWCGEEGVRMYAFGTGGSRSAAPIEHQARLVSAKETRVEVARRLYQMRFQEEPDPNLTIEQLRGWEGRRVREAYARASAETGVPWHGRSYRRDDWLASDPVNRALSAANACLYGVCHAAILSLGFSPALGFIHTGTALSFVYDIADLYKTAISIPAAFRAAVEGPVGIERRTRIECRDRFRELRLLERLADDLPRALGIKRDVFEHYFAPESPWRGRLWDPEREEGVPSGENYGDPDPGACASEPSRRAEPLDD